jgi:GMP synthase-like glutamine amidotransferase
LLIFSLSFPRKRESSIRLSVWIPAFAGMTDGDFMQKILVIQFSLDQSKEHAQECFKETCPQADFVFFNAIEDDFTQINLENFSGVIVGGSGQFYLSKGDGHDTWLPKVFKLVDTIFATDIPALGICFGSQILAMHQGAQIVSDPAMHEAGTLESSLLEDAAADIIFSNVPGKFMAQFGHKDTPINLPDHFVILSKSEKVFCNAFRVGNKKIWGVLFHPELSSTRTKERMAMFPSYVGEAENFEDYVNRIVQDSPETGKILSNFVRVALENKYPNTGTDDSKEVTSFIVEESQPVRSI